MALGVRQPAGVRLRGIVTRFTAPHRALAVRRHVVLSTFAACEVVVRTLQVLADIQPARIVSEVGGAVGACFLRVGGVIKGIVTVGTLKLAFGVYIPGTAELVLPCDVQAGIGDALGTVHLAGSCRFGIARLIDKVAKDQRLLEVRVNRAVTLAAVFVGRILDLKPGLLKTPVGVKRLIIPLPPLGSFGHQARAAQGSGCGITKVARRGSRNTLGVVRIGEMAEEAVHLQRTRSIPVPRFGLPSVWVEDVGLVILGVRRKRCQRCAAARSLPHGPTGVARSVELKPACRAQVQAVAAWLRQVAIGDRIPVGQGAISISGGDRPHRSQAEIGMEAVRGNIVRVVALAAGLHRRHSLAGFQHVGPVGVEQRDLGVKLGELGGRRLGSLREQLARAKHQYGHDGDRTDADKNASTISSVHGAPCCRTRYRRRFNCRWQRLIGCFVCRIGRPTLSGRQSSQAQPSPCARSRRGSLRTARRWRQAAPYAWSASTWRSR